MGSGRGWSGSSFGRGGSEQVSVGRPGGHRQVERGGEGLRGAEGLRGSCGAAATVRKGHRRKRAQRPPTSLPTPPSQTGTLRSKESEEFFWLRSRYDLAAELAPQRAYQPGRGPSTWGGGPQGGEGSCRRLWGRADGETPLVQRTLPRWGLRQGGVGTEVRAW